MARATSQFNTAAGLNRALRQLPRLALEQLRRASLVIAQDVAGDARSGATRVGGVARLVAPSIAGTRDRVPAIKVGGSGRLPATNRSRQGSRQTVGDVWAGAEYGGGRRPTTRQFAPWRGSGQGAGYFLWPAVRANRRQIHDRYSAALDDALQELR